MGRGRGRLSPCAPAPTLPLSPSSSSCSLIWILGKAEAMESAVHAASLPLSALFSPQAIHMHTFWNCHSVPYIFRGKNNVIMRSLLVHESAISFTADIIDYP